MGARTPSAPTGGGFDFGRAQDIVARAYEKQKAATEELKKKGEEYVAKGDIAQYALDRILGRPSSEALSAYETAFASEIPELEAKFEKKQKEFSPGVLDFSPTSSFSLLTDALRGGTAEFTGGVRGAADDATARLYATLAAPVEGFEAIANRPAFNKLYDPTFMELSKRPPTVNSDVDSFKSLYTYNV